MSNAIEARGGKEIEAQRLLPVRAEPEMQPTEDRLDLRSLLVTLRRRLGLILGVLATVLVLAIAITALQTPRYTASSQIALNTTENRVAPVRVARPRRRRTRIWPIPRSRCCDRASWRRRWPVR